MEKFRKLPLVAILALIVISLMAINGYCTTKVGTFGIEDSTNVYNLEAKSDNIVYVRPSGGIAFPYEAATTSDTITAQETGKTFIINPANAGVTFTLPDADVGLFFTFTQSVGSASGTKKFTIDPQSTDTIRGAVNGTSATTFAAGDSLKSPGATGDSVTIFCAEDTIWDVVDMRGTFVDNN